MVISHKLFNKKKPIKRNLLKSGLPIIIKLCIKESIIRMNNWAINKAWLKNKYLVIITFLTYFIKWGVLQPHVPWYIVCEYVKLLEQFSVNRTQRRKPLTIFTKSSILDIRLGSECFFGIHPDFWLQKFKLPYPAKICDRKGCL